jgi:hypothetical protein
VRALLFRERRCPQRTRVHPDDLPEVAVEVLEARAVHEPMVHRLIRRLTTGRKRLVHELVDLLAAFGRQRENRFRGETGSHPSASVRVWRRSIPAWPRRWPGSSGAGAPPYERVYDTLGGSSASATARASAARSRLDI